MDLECQSIQSGMTSSVGKLQDHQSLLMPPDVAQGRKNPLWMGLPSRLRRTRQQANLSARQVSLRAKCSNNSTSVLESGSHVPRVDVVERMAMALGVSPIWLGFGPEGDMPFRQKQPRWRVIEDEPIPRPGEGVFAERYKGCAERLKGSRERLGLSLRELSAAAQVSYQAVLYTESGQTVPRVDTIEAIAVALDVAPGWLAYGEDE